MSQPGFDAQSFAAAVATELARLAAVALFIATILVWAALLS